ncbi:MAG: ABC transporter ATP-binding protein [Candidatus Planktophila sp.]
MISFHNVSLIYPHSLKTVFEDLSFTIDEGEMVLVIGATGSGKSSLLRLINGLVPHHTGGILAGDITVDGISTSLTKPGGLAHLIGIVGQNPVHGFVTDTVEEELVFGMEALNFAPDVMRKRVEEVLDLLSLAHLRNRSISTLSGGEQQRVAIGSALVMHPKVLVLDEPTSALDPIAAEEVLSILHRLVHDLALTVVISEHKLERVIGFADRIISISTDGRAEIDIPEEILKKSKLAPPIVHLARALNLDSVGTSVREVRRMTTHLRDFTPLISEEISLNQETVVAVSNLSHRYGEKLALRDISLEFKSGEISAVMGRNGAGKSTLFKSIVGFHESDSGTISVLGKDPAHLRGHERLSTIGYIPQEPSDLLIHPSVIQECHASDRDNQLETGSTLAFLKRLVPSINPDAHPRDLSEGQRLSLVLALILCGEPDVLIMDEPTRGLDYQAKAKLVDTLISYARNLGKCVLIATHDVELVAEVADRVVFIADGDVVADGSTLDVLLSSPAFAPQVAKVMAPAPWLTVKDALRGISTGEDSTQ